MLTARTRHLNRLRRCAFEDTGRLEGVNPQESRPSQLDIASWEYSEDFVAPSEAFRNAHAAALEDGLPAVTAGTAAMLTFLARLVSAQTAVEIGTDAGVTALSLLSGMAQRGVLTSVDPEAFHQETAREVLKEAQIATNRFRTIASNPLDVLPKLRDGAYDLVLINGDRLEYVEYLSQALRLLRSGGLLIMNDALASYHLADPDNQDDDTLIIREALESVQQTEGLTTSLVPVGVGLLLAVKD